jgi:hypothetical protein
VTELGETPEEIPLPPEPPTEDDRESGLPRANGLPYRSTCRYCHRDVIVARMDDGQWRTFDTEEVDPLLEGVFVWHNRHGMQEFARNGRPVRSGERLVPGVRLHFCSERAAARLRVNLSLPLGGSPLDTDSDRRPKF